MDDVQGAASVARAWSGYVDALSGGVIANATASTVGEMHEHLLAKTPDFLAFAVCLAYCALLAIGVTLVPLTSLASDYLIAAQKRSKEIIPTQNFSFGVRLRNTSV